MKLLAIAFASVLLVSPAFAQTGVPAIGSALLNPVNVSNVPFMVSGVGQTTFQAGISVLDAREVGHIPALGPAAGGLAGGISGFLITVRPNP